MKKILTAFTCLVLILSYSCSEDNCADLDCGPNGDCNPDTGACMCDPGFSGTNCEINICDTTDCGSNGTCDPVTGDCNCEEGYSGENCEINVCDTVDCGPNGDCFERDGTCICNPGFEGERCETETRSNFVGEYIGDIVPCVPSILASQIPDDILESLTMTPIEVTPNAEDISSVDIGASNSMVLGLSVIANITEESFAIDEFMQELEVDTPIGTVTITVIGEGTGSFIDNDNMQLNLSLVYQTVLGVFNSECEIIFTKQ